MSRSVKVALGTVGALLVVSIGLQLIPVDRSNPAVSNAVVWNSAEAEALARAACYDCHSNETVWPWYSYVAPVSWLVIHDVNEGREQFNFSTQTGEFEGEEMIEEIQDGGMPLPNYLITHPQARLTDVQRETLIAGIQATFDGEGRESGEQREDDDD